MVTPDLARPSSTGPGRGGRGGVHPDPLLEADLVRTGGLTATADGNDVFFAHANGTVVNDRHNGTGWTGPSATGGGTAR